MSVYPSPLFLSILFNPTFLEVMRLCLIQHCVLTWTVSGTHKVLRKWLPEWLHCFLRSNKDLRRLSNAKIKFLGNHPSTLPKFKSSANHHTCLSVRPLPGLFFWYFLKDSLARYFIALARNVNTRTVTVLNTELKESLKYNCIFPAFWHMMDSPASLLLGVPGSGR